MAAYLKTAPPHIVCPDSVSKIMWKSVFALVPLMGVRLLLFGNPVAGYLLVSFLFVLAAEVLAKIWLNRSVSVSDGSSVLNALLIAAALPVGLPIWMVALGAFFSVFFGVKIFGGLGTNLFHPVAAGIMFLAVSFPDVFAHPAAAVPALPAFAVPLFLQSSHGAEWFMSHSNLLTGFAAVFGGLMLIWQRVIRWEVPLLYLLLIWLGEVFFKTTLFCGPIFLYAFFIITDPATTAATRKGQYFSALTAALLACLLNRGSFCDESFAGSVLLMNAVSPWFDLATQPKAAMSGLRRRAKIVETG